MEPLDLTKGPPRSPRMQLDGLVMLARTIDKMRASLPGGALGDYHVEGMSTRMLGIIGIEPNELQAVVAQASSDDEVAAWVREHADTSKYADANHAILNRRVADLAPERKPGFQKEYPGFDGVNEERKLHELLEEDDAARFGKKSSPAQ